VFIYRYIDRHTDIDIYIVQCGLGPAANVGHAATQYRVGTWVNYVTMGNSKARRAVERERL